VTFGAVALAALAAVPATGIPGRAPVRVDADAVRYAFQRREVTFTGTPAKPVTLTRDDAKLTCRRLVAQTDAGGRIISAACTGEVRFVRGARAVTCDRATFEDIRDRIVCDGNAVLRDGGSEARGTQLVYELATDEVQLADGVVTLPGEQIEDRRKALETRRKEARR
jgi:lipopolysaccharide export system protein LptA